MSFRSTLLSLMTGSAALLPATLAFGHASVSGPAVAGARQVLDVSIGHGCAGADTYRIEVHIPEEVTSVRALPGPFGEAEVTKNEAGLVTKVAWAKGSVRNEDDSYYRFAIRITVPDAPFTRLYFPTTQYCRSGEGEETVVEWAALPGTGNDEEPAPAVWIVPPRLPGWNKYTVSAAMTDLSVFDDAQIVWSGAAAYSANPTTQELIRAEADVDELTEIGAGADLWVKY